MDKKGEKCERRERDVESTGKREKGRERKVYGGERGKKRKRRGC
jgi:hypothetical protein